MRLARLLEIYGPDQQVTLVSEEVMPFPEWKRKTSRTRTCKLCGRCCKGLTAQDGLIYHIRHHHLIMNFMDYWEKHEAKSRAQRRMVRIQFAEAHKDRYRPWPEESFMNAEEKVCSASRDRGDAVTASGDAYFRGKRLNLAQAVEANR